MHLHGDNVFFNLDRIFVISFSIEELLKANHRFIGAGRLFLKV